MSFKLINIHRILAKLCVFSHLKTQSCPNSGTMLQFNYPAGAGWGYVSDLCYHWLVIDDNPLHFSRWCNFSDFITTLYMHLCVCLYACMYASACVWVCPRQIKYSVNGIVNNFSAALVFIQDPNFAILCLHRLYSIHQWMSLMLIPTWEISSPI